MKNSPIRRNGKIAAGGFLAAALAARLGVNEARAQSGAEPKVAAANSATAPGGYLGQKPADQSDFSSLSLDDLINVTVQTVSRREENLDKAPNTIYVITKQQIRERGYQRLQDLLQVIPGFGVAHRDLAWVNQIRGIAPNDNEKLTLMINGQPVNALTEPQYMNGALSLDAFERVEIIVGPGSVMYGSETLLATINLITRAPGENEAGVTAGSRDSYNSTGIFGKKWSDDRWFNGTATLATRGGFDGFSDSSRVAPGAGQDGLKGTHYVDQLHQGLFLTGQGNYDLWRLNSSLQYAAFPELHFRGVDESGDYTEIVADMSLRRNFELSPAWTAFVQGGYDYKSTERLTPNAAQSSYKLHQQVFSTEVGAEWDGEKSILQTGIQYKYKNNLLGAVYSDDTKVYDLYTKDTQVVGGYASLEQRFTDWFQVVAAGRIDHDTILADEADEVGARGALIFTPVKSWISKLTYNRATRVPTPWMSPINTAWGTSSTMSAAFKAANPWAVQNPVAEHPEILTTYEWDNIVYFHKTRWSTSLYYQELKNFMSWNNPFTNVGDFAGPGAETELRTPLTSKLDLWVNGSVQRTHAKPVVNIAAAAGNNTGLTLVPGEDKQIGVPTYRSATGFDWQVCPHLSLSLQARYLGDEPISDGGPVTKVARFYLDASALWRDAFVKGLDLRLTAANLTDNRDSIQAQWQPYTYRPEGIGLSVSGFYKF